MKIVKTKRATMTSVIDRPASSRAARRPATRRSCMRWIDMLSSPHEICTARPGCGLPPAGGSPEGGGRRSGTPPEVVLRDGLDYQLVVADGQPVAGETT